MCVVQEAFCEAFPDNIRNVNVRIVSGGITYGGIPIYSQYEVGIILSYSERELYHQRDKILFVMGDLTFGSYSPTSISQNQRYEQADLARDIFVYYQISDIDDFARVIKNSVWERFNDKISLEIDRTINEDN